MLVTLLCEDKLYSVLLPEKIRGRYWIEDTDLGLADPGRRILGIEGEENVWKISAGRKLKLYAPGQTQTVSCLELAEGQMYAAELPKGRKGYLFTAPYQKDNCTFQKYCVPASTTLNIGKSPANQIVIDNPYVSSVHAQISLEGDQWVVHDNDSRNGVYVNGERIHRSASVRPGDMLYIMGVKLIFGYQFIAMNNPGGIVKLDGKMLKPYEPERIQACEAPEELSEKIYYRSPQFGRVLVPLELKIDAPPAPERVDATPLALTLAPSLTMGVASFASGLITITTSLQSGRSVLSSVPTMLTSVSMLLGMIVFPFIMRRGDRRRKREREEERREKYLKYLGNIRGEIERASRQQCEILNANYPFVLARMREKSFYDMELWNRVIGQENFLALRVGVGNVPLAAKLVFSEDRFSIDDDIMREEVIRFSGEKQIITGVPVVYSLVKHRVSGIVGNGRAVNGVLNHLLLQIAALHSYDEVKLVFLCDEADLKKYSYVRWMPHIWDNSFRVRFLAATPEEVRSLSAYFLREMEKYRGERALKLPHYVVVSTSKTLSDGCAFLAEMLKDASIPCFSYLAVYDELKNLPKECSVILEVGEKQGILFNYKAPEGGQVTFVPDIVQGEDAAHAVMEVAEYRLDLQGGKYVLPDMLTFLDMYKVGKYEHLNITNRWKTSNPVASLQAPVGVNSDGGLFYLDLHEEAHGPHGLIAGMTGSGKSEFIITYVLSMAVNYSPEDVAFILIDYKGGGLVGAFEGDQYHLPHIAGTITNLDGASINRSLLSIQSELRRRQKVFGEARRIANEGTMDIYKYQKLYRSGTVSEPMPHLIIVSDEFAELKSQQPEFMAQLISTARIGRSLGVHLILATQKPSGVVNDQIWANSRFKVCLKVQDRADSMEMLKRPEAAELVESGRFYLQVGYNELFEQGQSAWSGAPYLPEEMSEARPDESVQMIDHQGNVVDEARPQRKSADSGKAKKQIVEIVQHLTRIGEEEQIQAKALWLPELPPRIPVERLEEKYHYQGSYALNPIIGELDDPFNQDQRLLTLPFSQKGNAICYGGAGSGKDEFLAAVLYSLYRTHTSDVLNAYILDFGAETLQMFAAAPQTGGIVLSGEDEKAVNLFSMLQREIVRRKKQFVSAGGDYLSYRRTGNADVPAIVVIINEYANFAEQYEALDDRMSSLTRDCTQYGIYFLLTNLSQTGVRYKLQQNFSQMFVLQMNDKSDYLAVLGNTGGVYPSKIPGRGIYREKDVYEFQTACVTELPEQTADAVKAFCGELAKSGQKKARPIPAMPRAVHEAHLGGTPVTFRNVPIGLNTSTAEPIAINLEKWSVCQVLAMDRQDTMPFAEGLANMFWRIPGVELFVVDPGRALSVDGIDAAHYVGEKPEELIVKLFELTVKRHNAYKTSGGVLPKEMEAHPAVIILAGLGQIKRLLSDDGQDKLRLMLEKTDGRFGLFFWAIDDYQSSNAYSTEGWCKGDGVWIGNGIGDQIRMKVGRKSSSMAKKLDFGDGFLVRRMDAQPVRLLISERMESQMEEDNDE